ncbi:MAG: DbpA RNA binding domain-containing protein [Exiguobacterium sp.]|nr:DbpA RNA binding domain-containing protein [Exiguobacterium sp.]
MPDEIAPFLDDVYRKFDLMEKEEILKKMVSMEFNTFLNYYKHAPEIVQPDDRGKKGENGSVRKSREERRHERNTRNNQAEEGYTRLFINIGKIDNLNPRQLMGFVNRCAKGKQIDIGRIDLMKTFSFFEVPQEQTKTVLAVLNGAEFDGRKVNVEVTENSGGGSSRGGGRRREERGGRNEERGFAKRDEKRKKKKAVDDDPFAQVRKKGHDVGKPAWARFFEGQVEDQPFYGEFTKKKKKKKK